MTLWLRRLALAGLAAATLLSACGLDDGARVRNQDNVRDVEAEADPGS